LRRFIIAKVRGSFFSGKKNVKIQKKKNSGYSAFFSAIRQFGILFGLTMDCSSPRQFYQSFPPNLYIIIQSIQHPEFRNSGFFFNSPPLPIH
jgi:hypothetical protein